MENPLITIASRNPKRNSTCNNYTYNYLFQSVRNLIRNCPSTAGNSMTGSERPSPEPLLKKEATPAVLGGESSGNALEPSNALKWGAWGIPAVLSRGIPGKALRAFPGSFRNFSGISSAKSQPYWGCGPFKFRRP